MALVYYIDYPCEVKEQVPAGRLLRLQYARERANEEVNKARRESGITDSDPVEVQLTIKNEDGQKVTKQTTAGEIRKQYAELERYSHHCTDCQVKVDSKSFGCRGTIDYPFSLKAEAFIMGLIHEKGGDPTSAMLMNYVENNGITGNRSNEMRKLPKLFFESDMPLARRLKDGRKLTSDHMFELLFQHEQIGATQARFLLGMLDIYTDTLPFDRSLDQLPELFVLEKEESGLVTSRTGLKLYADADDDRSTRQVHNFFYALFLAHEFKADVWVKG
ncbi:MAG: hypothetical protein ACYTDT_05875 [Planctomycetota bacterium]|jgi:hypothetical protein